MKRVQLIYEHPLFQTKYRKIREKEKDRENCKHTLEHFLDVARLMYIFSLEKQLFVSKELIYAIALMHDIGRIDQVNQGIPHEEAGAALCDVILPDCGFGEEERQTMKESILYHRGGGNNLKNPYCELLYLADKKSRNCFACDSKAKCNWDANRKNLSIEY